MRQDPRHPIATEVGSRSLVAWRADRLTAAGFDAQLAGRIAADPGFDVHAALELVDRGCPPPLAARIVAPLARGSSTR